MEPVISGVRHVKFWVSDLARSRDWYCAVFDLEQTVEFEDGDGRIRGVGFRVRGAGFSLMLREDQRLASALDDVDPVALAVPMEALGAWSEHLDALGIWHTPVIEGSGGQVIGIRDPDGIQIRLYADDPSVVVPQVFRSGGSPADEQT